MNKFYPGTFYPEDMLQIMEVKQKEKPTHIYLKSKTKFCNCPKCGQPTEQYHGTYIRTVQDLPVFGKTVKLHIRAHEYFCFQKTPHIWNRYRGWRNTCPHYIVRWTKRGISEGMAEK